MEVEQRSGKRVWYKQMRQCELCGATLVQSATKCKNCGSVCRPQPKQANDEALDTGAPKEAVTTDYSWQIVLGAILFIVVSIGATLRLDSANSLTLYFAIGSYLLAGCFTAFFVMSEAMKLQMGFEQDPYGKAWPNHWVWGGASLLLFPIALPIFLYVKSRYTGRDTITVSACLTLAILITLFVTIKHVTTTPADKLSLSEKAKLEKEIERMSDPAKFFTQ